MVNWNKMSTVSLTLQAAFPRVNQKWFMKVGGLGLHSCKRQLTTAKRLCYAALLFPHSFNSSELYSLFSSCKFSA